MGKLLRPILAHIAPLRRARACDPYTDCNQCNYSCGSCLQPPWWANYKCCLSFCDCCP
jgi:hypothetical protein